MGMVAALGGERGDTFQGLTQGSSGSKIVDGARQGLQHLILDVEGLGVGGQAQE